MVDINLETIVSRLSDVFSSEVDGETVMMNIQTGKYTSLNGTGGAIWNLIENPIKISEVCEKLLKEFDVTKEVCENEVLTFVNKLNENKLINIH